MLKSDYPEPFKSQKEYVDHLEDVTQKLHDSIEVSEGRIDRINKWSFTGFAALLALIVLMLLFHTLGTFMLFLEVVAGGILFFLVLFWIGFRNVIHLHHKSKVKDYKHYVEELEDVYKTLIKDKEGDAWINKENNLQQKSLKLMRLLKKDKEHFFRFLMYLGYLVLACVIVIVLKFVFRII